MLVWLNRGRVHGLYELTIKRTEILRLASTFCIAIVHLYNRLNHVFALLISMPYFKSINSSQNKSKIKLFLQKRNQIFRVLGAYPRPQWHPADGGRAPIDPRNNPSPTAKFWLSA